MSLDSELKRENFNLKPEYSKDSRQLNALIKWSDFKEDFKVNPPQIKTIKEMTWKELLNTNHETVIVQSYGYTEKSIFSSHFEPFSHLREFKFEIGRAIVNGKIEPKYSDLSHKWLYLEEPESELTFEEKDGKVYCFDPDLWARP